MAKQLPLLALVGCFVCCAPTQVSRPLPHSARAISPEPATEAPASEPPANLALVPRAIIQAGASLYVITGRIGGESPGPWVPHATAVDVPVDVGPASRIAEPREYTLLGMGLAPCTAVATAERSLRAYDYDPDRGVQMPVASYRAEELAGQACGEMGHGAEGFAFAIEGKHPTALLLTPVHEESLHGDDALLVTESLPETPARVISATTWRFQRIPLRQVGVQLETHTISYCLSAEGGHIIATADGDFLGAVEMVVEGRSWIVWQSWPQSLHVAAYDQGHVVPVADIQLPIALDYFYPDLI